MTDKRYKKKFLVAFSAYALVGVITLLILELISFTVLVSNDIIKHDQSLKKSIMNRYNEISTLWTVKTSYGAFDPVTLVRLVPNDTYGVLPIGKFGFIENKEEGTTFSYNKNDNITRVIMLGGSSMAGSGSSRVSETISSQLEQLINDKLSKEKSKRYYEVLNFGAGGGYSGAELVKFIQYLIYLEPDIVIALDGFNDAWNAIFEKNRIKISNPIINWSDYSYKYFESMNGMHVKRSSTDGMLPFMPFTSLAFNRIYSRVNLIFSDKETFYNKYPNYILSKEIYKDDPFFAKVFQTNLETLAALACRSNFFFIGALQPHAYSREENLTENEIALINTFETRYEATIESGINYSKLMNQAFDRYSKVYSELERKFSDCRSVKFVNLMNAFIEKKQDTYVDNIHYTPYGNYVIAKKFEALVNSLEQ